MKEYSFKYGKGSVKFSLDPALVLDELVINEFPALPDPRLPCWQPFAIPLAHRRCGRL